MARVLTIAAGGAVGAVLRYWVSSGTHALLGRGFPYGTLVVNVLGSFAIGFLFVLFLERMTLSGEWRAGILIGVLGAFTTFSTFSIETLNLLEEGAHLKASRSICQRGHRQCRSTRLATRLERLGYL